MLIIPEFCLYPGIAAFGLSYFKLLPIPLTQSIAGALIGYLSLWSIATIHYCITKKQGLGEGDFDLLALIGAYTGLEGILCTLLIASWSGTIIAGIYLLVTRNKLTARIPFAPFLALGAIIYVIMQPTNLLYHP
jgi:leader peptidase (prepilin peptidase)/N-methyltransferase